MLHEAKVLNKSQILKQYKGINLQSHVYEFLKYVVTKQGNDSTKQ